MSKDLQLFTHEKFGQVRTLEIDGRPYFSGTDVAKALGYVDPYDAIRRHTKGSVKRQVLTNGGVQEHKFISEGDIYRLIISSHLPQAEEFESWVFDEVLPSIRYHAMYATPDAIETMLNDPDTMIRTLQALKDEREARIKAEAEKKQLSVALEEQAPAVNGYERLISVDGLYTMAEAAQLLSNGLTKPIGQNKLYKMLKKWKAIKSDNSPYQHMIDRGLMNVKTTIYIDGDGVEHVKNKSMVTPKGLEYIRKRLLELQEIEEIAGEELF